MSNRREFYNPTRQQSVTEADELLLKLDELQAEIDARVADPSSIDPIMADIRSALSRFSLSEESPKEDSQEKGAEGSEKDEA